MAEQSRQAAEQITDLIQKMQQKTQEAVDSMGVGVKNVDEVSPESTPPTGA